MSTSPRILVIEDEYDIARFIEVELSCENYTVEIASDGMKGLIAARERPPDLIILDRMLPQLDGMEVCQRLRQSSEVPILMLSAKAMVNERVEGLDAGANDYLVKPFSLDELLARVRAQLRAHRPSDKHVLQFCDLTLDTHTYEVRRGEQEISLSPKEFEMLELFMRNPRQVLSRSRILELIWGWDFEGQDNVLEVSIHNLRDKIENSELPKLLHTVRGVGYILKS